MHARTARRLVAAIGLVLAAPTVAVASAQPGDRSGHRAAQEAVHEDAPSVEVSVMSQNIFYGGDDYDLKTGGFCPTPDGCPRALHRLARVIKVSGADVVGVQEAERNTRKLAVLLGWYASPRAHVISRFPILDPPHSHGLFTYVEPTPGRVIAVANTHLPSTPYGPYEVRNGKSRRHVLRLERRLRLPAVQPVLHRLRKLARQGVPVFLTGDFNSPSYLDWTRAVSQVRKVVRYPVVWPVSKALADAGFRDSYREIHPDPVADPGFTWTPGGPETVKHEVFDRIDWVLHAGPSTALDSLIAGERGGADVDLPFKAPYPTDHRGVVSRFAVDPAPAPLVVSPSARRVTIGHRLRVRFHSEGVSGQRIVLARRTTSGRLRVVEKRRPGRGSPTDGVVTFSTRRLNPGHFVVAIRAHHRLQAPASVWVYASRHRAVVRTRHSYRAGAPITVRWSGAPGENLDWIGLFRCTTTCGGPGDFLVYRYTKTGIVGRLRFTGHEYLGEGSVSWPLPPGTYIARLLVDDSYIPVGKSARFHVVAR